MQFLYPWVLWLSSLIVIPIIIHLFYFRRFKTVYFSNNRLLDNVIKTSRSQQRIRNLLILLLRILFILMLVLAFAQPVIKNTETNNKNRQHIYALYIDNSFSMSQIGDKTSLLEENKSKAITFIQSLPHDAQFLILYNGNSEGFSRLLNANEAIKKISNIEISAYQWYWSTIFKKVNNILSSLNVDASVDYVFFTDGQKYAIDPAQWDNTSKNMYLFYASSPSNTNICIDTVYFEQPNHFIFQQEKIHISITNRGLEALSNIPLKIFINDTIKATTSVTLEVNENKKIEVSYQNPSSTWVKGIVEIDDFPVTFDNRYYFSYPLLKSYDIAVIGNYNEYLDAFFKSDSNCKVQYFDPSQLKIELLYRYTSIVVNTSSINSGLWDALVRYVSNGGCVVYILNNDNNEKINQFFNPLGINLEQTDTSKIFIKPPSYEIPFYKNLFKSKVQQANMPWVRNYRNINYTSSVFPLLTLENNRNVLVQRNYNRGKWFIFSFAFDKNSTNLTSHPLFVAILHKIIQLSQPNHEIAYYINENNTIRIDADTILEQGIRLNHLQSQKSITPIQRFSFNELILYLNNIDFEDGHYQVLPYNNRFISLNYERKESNLQFYKPDELTEILSNKNIKTSIIQTSDSRQIISEIAINASGRPLWKWFLIASLIFIVGEMLIIKFWNP